MITELRRNCENFARCGATGHYVDENKVIQRCPCKLLELTQSDLGAFFCDDPIEDTSLIEKIGNNLILEGGRDAVTRHVAGALLHLGREKKTWAEVNSQRLAEIFLDKDEEGGLKTTASWGPKDLVLMWLGWGELPNKRLPECILGLMARRWYLRKPLWVYMSFDVADIPTQYRNAPCVSRLARELGEFQQIELR